MDKIKILEELLNLINSAETKNEEKFSFGLLYNYVIEDGLYVLNIEVRQEINDDRSTKGAGNHGKFKEAGIVHKIYFNTKNDAGSISWECYKLFTDMYVENGDKITTNINNTAPFDENALNLYNYRFCALKNQAEREKVFANNAANTKFRFGVCIN